jgi:hypothetical protein
MTTATVTVTPADLAGYETVFSFAVRALRTLKSQFKAGVVEPAHYGLIRDTHLGVALRGLAGLHGVALASPLQVHGNSEFCLTAMPADGSPLEKRAGQFGTFAELLNKHAPHNGLSHCTLSPTNGMCFMSDIGVEALVLEEADARGI